MRQKKKIQKKINGQISSANYGQMRLAATISDIWDWNSISGGNNCIY